MTREKSLLSLLVILLCCTLTISVHADMVDLVVLLDVSQSMLPYYDATVDYLLKDIIMEHLHPDDTFHLISFSDFPEREIQQTMRTNEDISAVLDRVVLLQPLGKYTDLVFALRYLYQYTADLSLRTKKNIIILTDGIHDPPPGSTYPITTEEQRTLNEKTATETFEKIRKEGWSLNLVEFPKNGSTDEAEDTQPGMDIYKSLSESHNIPLIEYDGKNNGTFSHEATGAPKLLFPEKIIRGNRNATIPFKITNYKNDAVFVKLDRILFEGKNILIGPVNRRIRGSAAGTLNARVQFPEMNKGLHDIQLELVFSDTLRIFPRTGTIRYKYSGFSWIWLKYVLFFAAGLLLIVILFRYIIMPIRMSISTSIEREHYHRSIAAGKAQTGHLSAKQKPVPVTVQNSAKVNLLAVNNRAGQSNKVSLLKAASHPAFGGNVPLSSISTNTGALLSSKETQHYPIEMRVLGQNPLIGNRNIHWIGQKHHSVGGRGSSFFIFLYPVPSHIAEISFETGSGFVFTPVVSDFFPGLHGPLKDCIHKEIVLKNRKGDEMIIIFHEWESPLERINRILRLTRQTGTE